MDIIRAEKYYPQIKERFPELSEKQIDKIVKHGLRAFYMHTKNGADILVSSPYFTAYFGKLFRRNNIFLAYTKIKWTIKYRLLYTKSKKPFNGKYYFVTDQELNDPLKKGRRRDKVHFDELCIYKVYGESTLQNKEYIYEMDYPEDLGYKYTLKDVTVNKPRLVAKRCGYRTYNPVSIEGIRNETRKNKYMKRRT